MRALTSMRSGGRRPRETATPDVPVELVLLSDADFSLSQPNDDILGRIVVDKARIGVGVVYDLLVEPMSRRAFLMIVRGSDILLGDKDPLIPIDAIRYGDDEYVYLGQGHESVVAGPAYDPGRLSEPEFQVMVYGWYGSLPYWHPEYVYPTDWSQMLEDSAQRPRLRR